MTHRIHLCSLLQRQSSCIVLLSVTSASIAEHSIMMLTHGIVDYGMLIRQQVRSLAHLQNLDHLSVLFVYQPVFMLIVTINHVTNVFIVDMKYVTRAVILVNVLQRRTGMAQCV